MTKRKKLSAILLGAILALGVGAGVGASRVETGKADSTYTYTFTAKVFDAYDQTKKLGDFDWTVTRTAATSSDYLGTDPTKGQQFGSGTHYVSKLNLVTSDIPGTITEVKISTSGAASITANVGIKVGSTSFLSGADATKTITATNAEYTFSGSASGAIDIEWNNTSKKAIYLKTIKVTYVESGGAEFGTLASIAIKDEASKKTFVIGETFSSAGLTLTATDTEGVTKTVNSGFITDYDGTEFSSSHLGTKTVNVSYTEGVTKNTSYDITVLATLPSFKQVSADDALNVGATYTIGTAEGASRKVISNLNSGGKFYDYTEVTISSDEFDDNASVLKLKLENGSKIGTYAFKIINTESAGKYITYSGASNDLYATELESITDGGSWTYTTNGIENVGTTGRFIRYNNSSPRFSAYTSAQTAVSLFVDESTIIPEPEFENTTRIELATDFAKKVFFTQETFTSAGLIVVAYDDVNEVSKNVNTGFTTDLDGKVFTSADVEKNAVVTVTYDGIDETYTIDINEARSFVKVTSQSQLKVDGLFIATGIDTDDGLVALGKQEGTNRNAVSIIESDGKVFENDSVQILKLHHGHTIGTGEEAVDSYAFESIGGPKDGQFLAATGTGTANYLTSEATVTLKGSWVITIGESTTIEATGAGYDRSKMRYNDTSDIFSAYNGGQTDITLYVFEEPVNPDIAVVDDFVDTYMYMDEIEVTDKGTGECKSEGLYADAKAAFNALSATQRALFVTDAQYDAPRARLIAWAVANNEGLITATNTLGIVVSPSQNTLFNGLNDSNTIMLIVIISLISVSVLGGVFYLRKREQN